MATPIIMPRQGQSVESCIITSWNKKVGDTVEKGDIAVLCGLSKAKDLNRETLKYVTAEAQAEMYRRIEHLLLEDEREVSRRAANSTHLNRPKHASVTDYRYATGFEALIGMLVWIKDEERLEELLKEAHKENRENDTEN